LLDVGAGSGRSTVMVLRERPNASVTALDIFAAGYGIDGNTPERLKRNAVAAGGADRLNIVTGDMRAMPLAANSFEGVVSSFAIDHVSREDVRKSLGEVRRVLKPGGDFLLLVIRPDWYVRVAYPMAAEHGYVGPRDTQARWKGELAEAGFELIEVGHQPGTLYLLARSPD
ncbi:MAG: class I SAM-dependent methyltransferase, partial [Steroidobacteraceae bacterium]